MPSRRGFIGAFLTGAAAVAANKVHEASGAVEEIERKFIVPTDIAKELEEAKHEFAAVDSLKNADVVREFRVTAGGASWYGGATAAINRMPDDVYLHFLEEHKQVNARFGIMHTETQSGHPQHRFNGNALVGDV